MSCEWTTFTFEQLKAPSKSAFAMGPFGSNIKAENFVTSGVPVIKGGNLNGTYLTDSFSDFLSQEKADELASSKARPLDLVITHRGTLGQVGLIPENSNFPEYIVSQSQLKLSFDRVLVDPYFIYYFLRSPLGQQRLLANKSQVGVPAIAQALTTVRQIKVNLPPLNLQREITNVLRAIDDRITLLRKTNKTLESIAQAIFKSWFVDFEPVRAKMEGRQPEGMDEATAALFPDSFEELGLIPSGWKVKTVGDVTAALGGATPNTKTEAFWTPGEYHWTTPKDLSGAQSPVLLDTVRRISAAGLAKISSGLLPAGTLLMSSRAPIGYLTISRIPVAINQGYIAMPPGGELAPLFMYFWCKMNMDIIKGHANGSTFMEISKKAFRPIPIVVPPSGIIDSFTQIAGSLFNKISINTEQADALSSLRDTLLPRLISGQLRLPEAQTIVEEHNA